MKFLQNIRTKLGYNTICRKAKKLPRKKTFHNLESALSVGFIFDSTHQEDYLVAKALVPELAGKGKKVYSIGMVPNSGMLGYYTPLENMKFISYEEFTFLCFPKDEATVNAFINKEFDILLNLCAKENLFVDYLMALSKAKFKVSPQLSNNNFADFILQFKDNKPLNSAVILSKIREYLSAMQKS